MSFYSRLGFIAKATPESLTLAVPIDTSAPTGTGRVPGARLNFQMPTAPAVPTASTTSRSIYGFNTSKPVGEAKNQQIKVPGAIVLPEVQPSQPPQIILQDDVEEFVGEENWMEQTLFSGIKNKWLLAGGGVVLVGGFLLTRKKSAAVAGYRRRSRR